MIRKTLSILILFTTTLCFSQTIDSTNQSNIQQTNFDSDFYNFLLMKWNSGEELKYSQDKIKHLEDYFNHLESSSLRLLTPEFLSLPNHYELIANFINTKIEWSKYYNADNKSVKQIIEEELNNVPKKIELIVFYWRKIFITLGNNIESQKEIGININCSELNLNTNEESILYLTFIKHYASHLNSYAIAEVPTNCNHINELSIKMPLFNNQHFSEYEIREFNDFNFEWSRYFDKYSFKETCMDNYEMAISELNKCSNK